MIQPFTARIRQVRSLKFGLVHFASYLSVYGDAGYTWLDQNRKLISNKLPESFLLGTGIGLDLVTYYDKMIRIEYSVNKLGESGIFIHLIAGI